MSDMSLLGRLFGSRSKDPYWERFIYTAPVDPNNSLTPAIQAAPEGNTFPVKTEVEDPAIMSRDLKELATTMGASMAGVAALTPELLEAGGAPPEETTQKTPYGVVCVFHAEYDPREALGVGGQLPVQEAAILSFSLRAYIRELGYYSTIGGANAAAVAAAADLGRLGKDGRLVTKKYGAHVWVGEIVRTDLPLAPDGPPR